jgi:hypothetical protein
MAHYIDALTGAGPFGPRAPFFACGDGRLATGCQFLLSHGALSYGATVTPEPGATFEVVCILFTSMATFGS